ncbi:MAG: hypothetical protein QNJ94_02640, partial [Alphaproteobacteria bacterium]|nr:hypothetical protein [Alphaproteobacteria bacterium]
MAEKLWIGLVSLLPTEWDDELVGRQPHRVGEGAHDAAELVIPFRGKEADQSDPKLLGHAGPVR